MPVDTTHPAYDAAVPSWNRLRDVLSGHDAMVAGGAQYLPKLSGQTPEDYRAYQQRAAFHEATSRTVDGLTGAIFRKAPKFEIPTAFETLVERFSNRGVSAEVFSKTVARETIEVGRYGVLVDIRDGDNDPYSVGYAAEDILNWREAVIDGKPVLTLVVLRETAQEPDPDDPFKLVEVQRVRVLQLGLFDEAAELATYSQTLWQKRKDEGGRDQWIIAEGPIQPKRRGVPLNFIPFIFFAPDNLKTAVAKSPINGLALANIAHWRTSADLKHGAHFTALPTAWIAGEYKGGDADTLQIGSGVAWQLEENAKVGMLEFTGAGLGAVRQIREDEKADMSVLGARLLEDQKSGVEAAATVMLRHRGENSVLANIADTASRGLSVVLQTMVWWAGGPEPEFIGGTNDQVKVMLNTDFVERALSPQEMVQLVAGWQQGGYGGEVLYKNLRDGERLPEDMSFEDWQADIEDNGPATAVLGAFDEPDLDDAGAQI